MTAGVFELAVIVIIAAGLGVIARMLKQPAILAYLATGVIAGYLKFLPTLGDRETFSVLADLGIMFLLFLIGLEINYSSLRLVGKTSLIVGVAQIILTFAIGFALSVLFQFSYLHAAYIAVALTFSSTIIVVNLLTEKKDLNSLYGKISVGFLLVQDFIAILILVVLSGFQMGDGVIWFSVVTTLVKGVALFGFMLWLGKSAMPYVFNKVAQSRELLFLVSLAWVFLMSAIVGKLGFPIEIGGFLAGLALANSAQNFEIAGRVRPLRDFFILIFFVILGSSIAFSSFSGLAVPILVFSFFVLVGNPLIVLVVMGFMGYRKRTSFLTGMTVAQISEFSLVLVALGLKIGHISPEIVTLVTGVGVVTITISTYLIIYGDKIYRRIHHLISIFEKKNAKDDDVIVQTYKKPIILIGAHRTGRSIADQLSKKDLLIIDFDPDVVKEFVEHKYDVIFGDIADPEIFEKAGIAEAKLVISTSPDFEDNMNLLQEVMNLKANRPKVILRSDDEKQAEMLYKEGADYVLLPNFTSGQYLGKTVAYDADMKILSQLRKKDLEMIAERVYR